MGVVNVTDDSFSDGGLFLDRDRAVSHGVELVAQGAAIVDVGGEFLFVDGQPEFDHRTATSEPSGSAAAYRSRN